VKIHGYQCDECGVQKQQSNHWVIARTIDRSLAFTPWDEHTATSPAAIHLCGSGCAAKVLSKVVHEWSSR
jgi:hypothetical protein